MAFIVHADCVPLLALLVAAVNIGVEEPRAFGARGGNASSYVGGEERVWVSPFSIMAHS